MDPILRIVNYLFQKHNLKNDADSIDSFFNNGTSFPNFIELIFNEKILGLIGHPTEQYQRMYNNDSAFAFLLSKSDEIADLPLCYETEKDKSALLSLLLTKKCFKIDENKIVDDCNMIVQSLGIKYQNILELQNINCILSLLNVITDNKISIPPETNDISQIIIDISKKTKVPIVIDKSSLDSDKKFTFLIQILIIFDFFSKEVSQINTMSNLKKIQQKTNEKNQTSENIQQNLEEEVEEIFNKQLKIKNQNDDLISNSEDKKEEVNHQNQKLHRKSRNVFEITLRGRKNDFSNFDSSLNEEEEEENEHEEQKEQINSNLDITQNIPSTNGTNPYKPIKSINFDEEQQNNQNENNIQEEEDQEDHPKQTKNINNNNDDEEEEDQSEYIMQTKNIYISDDYDKDQEEKNKQTNNINDKNDSEEEEEEEFLYDEFKQEDENDDYDEEYNTTDETNHENLEKEEEEEEDDEKNHEYCNFFGTSTIIKLENEKGNLNEKSILKTINSIGSNKFVFSDILDAIKIENIVKFLEIFFEESNDKSFFNKIIIKESSYSSKMKEIINFLAQKISIFKFLRLDFSDEIHKKSSAVLLYTKILDLYFLKKTKSEILYRCETLLFTKINDKETLNELSEKIKKNSKRRKSILLNWNTYLALVYFVNEGKIHFQKFELPSEKYSFKKKQIPQIIDEKYLQQTEIDSSPLYYQLQFIFNELDKQGFYQYLVESYLICTRKINQMKVPKYCSTIANDMIPKYISFAGHKKRNNEDEDQDNDNKMPLNEGEYDQTESKPVEGIKVYQEHIRFDYMERGKTSFNDEEQQNGIEKFKDRYLDLSIRMQKSLQYKKPGELPPAKQYWNAIYDKSKYKKGIFVSSQEQKSNLYDAAICSTKETPINMQDECNKKIINFLPKVEHIEKFKLFKFFIYSEEEMKWNINNAAIDSFIEKMNIDPKKSYTPLVLCFNSNTDDLITLNSVLIDNLYPNRRSKQIFVYALYGRALESLISTRNRRKKIVEKRNPIYLLLHVPECKKELENINIIIYQIYYFLSIICDIEIVVLNKKYYEDQINLLEKFEKIKVSYDRSISSLFQLKNLQSSKMAYRSYKSFRPKKDNIDDDSSSDGDESEDDDEIKSKKNGENDQYNDDLLATMDFSNLFINLNSIILINNENINGYNKWTDKTQFVKSLEKKFPNSKVHFINVNEQSTYVEFLTTLNQICFNCIDYTSEDAFNRFQFIPIANVCAYFIQYKLGIENQTPLETMINNRFHQMLDYIKKWENDLYFLSELDKEILKTYPSIDDDYFKECNSIISSIKDEKASKKKEVIIKELGKSSKSSINYWENKIKKKDYLSKIDRNNLKINHSNFLESEYFDIISKLFQIKEISLIFDRNYSILSEQIKKDNLIFDDIFRDFDDRIKQENQQNVKETISDLKDKATNYMIREKENIREIKVIVEAGKLDEVFESDF